MASLGRLDLALVRAGGPRVGALFMAEQLVFQEGLGQGGAIDHHKRTIPPRAPLVDRTSQHFFTGPGFPKQQGYDVGSGHSFGRLDDHPHLGTGSDYEPVTRIHFGSQEPDFLTQLLMFKCFLNHQHQVVYFERLGDEVVGAHFNGFDGPGNRPERRHHDDGGARRCLPSICGARQWPAVTVEFLQEVQA